jgi:DNA-binding protein YbaB
MDGERPHPGDGVDGAWRAADLRTLPERIAGVRETAESDDGLVNVTVDGHGQLLDLSLDPGVYRRTDPVALAREITETAHRATALAGRRMLELTRSAGDPEPADDADPAFDPLLRELDRLVGR